MALAMAGSGAWAQDLQFAPVPAANEPVLMEAKQLGYDNVNKLVIAQGNVEVVQGNYVLRADKITYYQAHNVVRAQGNVSVLEPNGNVYFSNDVQLKDDMKAGVIHNFRARLSDNSLFAANEVHKLDENRTKLSKAVYSPCKLCEDSAPLWQLKASEVEIDQKEQRITYDNARLEVYGVPVAYTPYFSHPTPGADRKTGFLTPTYSSNSNLGAGIRAPYYINIAPDKDATLTPIFVTKEAPVLEGEYRQLTDNGSYHFEGSITDPVQRDATGARTDGRELRGHIFAHGENYFDEDSPWKVGFDIERTTDDTYLRRYKYGNQNTLNSRAYVEGAEGRNYALMQTLAFQGLRLNDDPGLSPLVFPSLEGYYETDPGSAGQRYYVSGNALALTRSEGTDSRRLSSTVGAKLPFVSSGGHIIETEARLRGDYYSSDDLGLGTSAVGPLRNANEGRVMPLAATTWRYPLIKRVGDAEWIVEPIVMAVATTESGNKLDIPNEDNVIAEFTDANLFSIDRFYGYDTIDEGSRVSYGGRSVLQFDRGYAFNFLFGQNYSVADDTPFPYSNDPDSNFSDYVGRVGVDYAPINFAYRFRLDEDELYSTRDEFQIGYLQYPLSATASYISLNDDPILGDRQEANGGIGWAMTPNWTISASARRDLEADAMLYAGAGLTYQNECVTVFTNLSREYISDRDIKPDTSISVRVALKNLN